MTIICGPIVRHTNRSVLNLWQILDEPLNSIDLQVFESDAFSSNIAVAVSHQLIKLGTNCFAVLVTAEITPSATCECIYYDIVVNGAGLRDTGLNKTICLNDDELPSVAIPRSHLHIVQASCRKPQDDGGIDQLAALSVLIADNMTMASRPSQLYLTGDQIYADDVSPLLLQSFEGVRESLGLAHEDIYTAEGVSFDPDNINLDSRANKANSKSGFTSGEKDSHLLSFAEYLCMYLFSFAGLLPGQTFASHNSLQARLSYSRKKSKTGKRSSKVYKYSSAQYRHERPMLEQFSKTASTQVRKLFANISVYMIFDDHDVTDDWNLTRENNENLSTSTLGRQVYVNALSSYLVCQHWGNQPDDVSSQLRNKIETLALEPAQENHTVLEALFSRYWGFILQQTPPAVILDTRTQRIYEGDNLRLMSKQRIAALGTKLAGLAETPTLILISPTPVYGFSRVEAIQLKFSLAKKTTLDREPWIASEDALNDLQNALLRTPGIKHVAILSGDVHYGFSRRKYLQGSEVAFWQFCSSAACNSPVGGRFGLPLTSAFGKLFDKDITKYLLPEGVRKHFLTPDRNVGTLKLDSDLIPIEAKLLCCSPHGEPYSKTYDLVNPKEYPADVQDQPVDPGVDFE